MFVVLSALFALLEPWPLALLVDGVLGNQPPPSWLTDIFGDGRFTLLGVAVGLGFIVTAGIHGLAVVTDYINTKLDQHIVLDFRSDLFRHCHRLSFGWHSDRSTGQLMNRINFQANSIGAVTLAFPPMVESFITVVGMFIVAFSIDPQLALIAMTVVPFVYYSVGNYTNRVEPEVRRVKGMEAENMNIVHEAMAMLRVIVSFGRERHEYRRFREQGEKTIQGRVRVTVRQTLFSMAVALITAAGTALVLWFGASNVLRGRLSVGQLLVVISYIAAVYTPLQGISTGFATLQQQVVGLQMSFDLLDIEPEVQEKPEAVSMDRAQGHVVFEDVSFSYIGREETLTNVSFEAKPGEAIALVGPTGAGKSTIVSLIPRFHDPQEGRVLLDGHDLRDLTVESLRRQISVVLQDPQLFSGTIEENIRYGRLDASKEEVIEAAKAANAHDFIMRLPEKYQTRVGEGGAKLSGGERQRISIARAFLRDAPILILDEPTSSIDSKTEEVILDALGRIMEGRTTFVIAHRLSTVHHADRYLVVQDGKIVEDGTHQELLERQGLYRQLWDAQVRRRGKRRLPRAEDVLAKKIAGTARSLQSPKPRVRSWAREALQRLDRAVVAEWARNAMASDDQHLAELGARVTGALQLVSHAGAVLERAAALPPPERTGFVEALRSFELQPSALVPLLGKVAPRYAGNAVHIVHRVGGVDAIPLLRQHLLHPNPSIRASVLHVLAAAGQADAVSAAENAVSLDSSPRVRAAAIGVLRRSLTWQRRRPFFLSGIADPAPQVRARAVSLLPVRLDEEVLSPTLLALGDGHERVWREPRKYLLRLDDDDLRLVRMVVRAYLLGRHDGLEGAVERVLPEVDLGLLIAVLNETMREPIDDELLTRLEAGRRAGVSVAAIVRWEREGVLPAERLEAGPKVLVRIRTRTLLDVMENGHVAPGRRTTWTSRTAKALRPMLRLLMDAEPHRGLVVAQLLVRLIGPRPFVDRMQEDMDVEIRTGAVEALALIGGERSVSALGRAAADPYEGLRVRALELLGQVRHPQAAQVLKRVHARVRQAAALGTATTAETNALERALEMINGHESRNGEASEVGGRHDAPSRQEVRT